MFNIADLTDGGIGITGKGADFAGRKFDVNFITVNTLNVGGRTGTFYNLGTFAGLKFEGMDRNADRDIFQR